MLTTPYTSKTEILSHNSFRATRHALYVIHRLGHAPLLHKSLRRRRASTSRNVVFSSSCSLFRTLMNSFSMVASSARVLASSYCVLTCFCRKIARFSLSCIWMNSRMTRSLPFMERLKSFLLNIVVDTFQRRQELHVYSTGGWPGETHTLELLGSSSRTLSVHMNQRPSKASRRVRTTLRDHATLGIEGVPTLHLSPSAAWDSLYAVLSMVCQGGDASRVTNVPTPLSHLSASPTLHTFTPCTLARWDARRAREGGVRLSAHMLLTVDIGSYSVDKIESKCDCQQNKAQYKNCPASSLPLCVDKHDLENEQSKYKDCYRQTIAVAWWYGRIWLNEKQRQSSESKEYKSNDSKDCPRIVVLRKSEVVYQAKNYCSERKNDCKPKTNVRKHCFCSSFFMRRVSSLFSIESSHRKTLAHQYLDSAHGRETSIPRPLKYMPFAFVLVLLAKSEVSYAS